MPPSGKQPRKAAKSFSEFASTFAEELGSLAGAARSGAKTDYAARPDVAASASGSKPKKKKSSY